jgi:transcription initiation factor TFIIIB Brf1 subunit/transcription initiation factor TFIIB
VQAGEKFYTESDNDSQLFPQMYFSNRDSAGKPVNQRQVRIFRRTAKYQNLKSKERSAVVFETRIRRLASQRNIPTSVWQRAVFLSRAARKTQAVKKPSLQAWAFSLLLAACREVRFVVTIEDLVGQDGKEMSNVRRYYNLLKKSLNLKIPPPSVSNYITYFSGKLGFNALVAIRATYIAKEHRDLNSAPHCVAASALYIAAKEFGHDLSQKSFCQKVGISEITLRNWVATLGGYKPQRTALPEPKADDLEGEKDERSDGEQDPENHAPEPAAPEETERNDDAAEHGKKHAEKRDARKEVRNRRVRNPRRTVKRASKPKKKAANRDNSPVQHSKRPRRAPERRNRAGSRGRV